MPRRAILPAWIVVLTVLLPIKIVLVLTVTFEPTVICPATAAEFVARAVAFITELTVELPTVNVVFTITSAGKETVMF